MQSNLILFMLIQKFRKLYVNFHSPQSLRTEERKKFFFYLFPYFIIIIFFQYSNFK